MIAQFIGWVIGDLIGGLIGDSFVGGRRARAAKHRVFIGGLRVVAGHQAGLTREWLIGEWSVRSGRMVMGELTVELTDTVAGSRRPARLSESLGGEPTIIMIVRTETATLEWSMLRRFDGLALRALGLPEGTETSA